MILKWCEREGVHVRVGARVTAIRGDGRAVLVAELDPGEKLEAETIIVSAGVRPNADFPRGSGSLCETGVVVDATMQTNVPGVYAAADVAAAIDFATGVRAMNAIQPNAVEQARVAALNMAGRHVESHGNIACGSDILPLDEHQKWRIVLEPLSDLVLGAIVLPRHRVQIFLAACDADRKARFIARFELYFRRTGG